MGSCLSAPGPQQIRFAAYIEGLAEAAGHADRRLPLKNYCMGLLLPGQRKSIEPIAARLAPDNVEQTHQSLHHLVADAPWDDERMLTQVREQVLPEMMNHGPVVAWIVDDTGFPKKGSHSVGVARQYCGQVGKQDNCQVAVSLSLSTWSSSMPISWRLYLPEIWANDPKRRKEAKVPKEITFQTKPKIALEQMRQAVKAGVPQGVVMADAGYGVDTQFRMDITQLGLQYVMGIQPAVTVWEPGKHPLPAKPAKGMGRPSKLLRRDGKHQPVSVKELALALPSAAWKNINWREGSQRTLRSRFAAVRVRVAHRDYERTEPHCEEWLLIEWPKGESEPATGSSSATTKNSSRRWDWATTKVEAGAGSIITPLSVLLRMGS